MGMKMGITMGTSVDWKTATDEEACKNATGDVSAHFANISKIVKAGISEKQIEDILLTRYACYLVVQNGDSRKTEIAQAQTYFAIQTQYAEIQQMEENRRQWISVT